jgi:hypothetical protein
VKKVNPEKLPETAVPKFKTIKTAIRDNGAEEAHKLIMQQIEQNRDMLKSKQEQESVQKRQEAELMRLFKRSTNMSVVDDAEAVAESGIHTEEDE